MRSSAPELQQSRYNSTHSLAREDIRVTGVTVLPAPDYSNLPTRPRSADASNSLVRSLSELWLAENETSAENLCIQSPSRKRSRSLLAAECLEFTACAFPATPQASKVPTVVPSAGQRKHTERLKQQKTTQQQCFERWQRTSPQPSEQMSQPHVQPQQHHYHHHQLQQEGGQPRASQQQQQQQQQQQGPAKTSPSSCSLQDQLILLLQQQLKQQHQKQQQLQSRQPQPSQQQQYLQQKFTKQDQQQQPRQQHHNNLQKVSCNSTTSSRRNHNQEQLCDTCLKQYVVLEQSGLLVLNSLHNGLDSLDSLHNGLDSSSCTLELEIDEPLISILHSEAGSYSDPDLPSSADRLASCPRHQPCPDSTASPLSPHRTSTPCPGRSGSCGSSPPMLRVPVLRLQPVNPATGFIPPSSYLPLLTSLKGNETLASCCRTQHSASPHRVQDEGERTGTAAIPTAGGDTCRPTWLRYCQDHLNLAFASSQARHQVRMEHKYQD